MFDVYPMKIPQTDHERILQAKESSTVTPCAEDIYPLIVTQAKGSSAMTSCAEGVLTPALGETQKKGLCGSFCNNKGFSQR